MTKVTNNDWSSPLMDISTADFVDYMVGVCGRLVRPHYRIRKIYHILQSAGNDEVLCEIQTISMHRVRLFLSNKTVPGEFIKIFNRVQDLSEILFISYQKVQRSREYFKVCILMKII